MREYKFRVWNKIKKEMSYEICEININDKKLSYHNNIDENGCGYCNEYDFDDLEIMQYTGLKDKNGKEIYEGDIISYWAGFIIEDSESDYFIDNNGKHYKRGKNTNALIIFDNSSFRIKNGNPLGSKYIESKEIEIIGNVYENPELIQESK